MDLQSQQVEVWGRPQRLLPKHLSPANILLTVTPECICISEYEGICIPYLMHNALWGCLCVALLLKAIPATFKLVLLAVV